ncbi:MAG: fibrobacter succinogenes major paralogous domain-containing protein [Bacteroidetes bacterium]|nr:fibrobacter succinogenes major paralogous domain-containing protein [Bacteroidota bacterium]
MKRLTVLFCVLTLLGMHLRAQSVADIEGNIYTIVQIGRQYWLQENLRVTQFGDGSPIETTNPASLNICTEKSPLYQWAYDDNLNNVAAYGRLYTWYTIADSRKLCPWAGMCPITPIGTRCPRFWEGHPLQAAR